MNGPGERESGEYWPNLRERPRMAPEASANQKPVLWRTSQERSDSLLLLASKAWLSHRGDLPQALGLKAPASNLTVRGCVEQMSCAFIARRGLVRTAVDRVAVCKLDFCAERWFRWATLAGGASIVWLRRAKRWSGSHPRDVGGRAGRTYNAVSSVRLCPVERPVRRGDDFVYRCMRRWEQHGGADADSD